MQLEAGSLFLSVSKKVSVSMPEKAGVNDVPWLTGLLGLRWQWSLLPSGCAAPLGEHRHG